MCAKFQLFRLILKNSEKDRDKQTVKDIGVRPGSDTKI